MQSFPSKYVALDHLYGRMKEPQSNPHSDPLNPTISESMGTGIHIPGGPRDDGINIWNTNYIKTAA